MSRFVLCLVIVVSLVGIVACSSSCAPPSADGGIVDAGLSRDAGADDAGAIDAGTRDAGPGDAGSVEPECAIDAGPEAPLPEDVVCDDVLEGENMLDGVTLTVEDGAPTALSIVPGVFGDDALRVTSDSGFLVTVRVPLAGVVDASTKTAVTLAVRGAPTSVYGWQVSAPIVALVDEDGARLTLTPATPLAPTDGVMWRRITLPLDGGLGVTSDGVIDRASIVAVEISVDVWEAGFVLDVDGLAFVGEGERCLATCGGGCGAGVCDATTLRCLCPLGSAGASCEACAEGFVASGAGCVLVDDGVSSVWPNAHSQVTGDAWLRVHHDEIAVVRPRILALHFVNHAAPATAHALLARIVDGIREGSRAHGHRDDDSTPRMEPEILPLVDLRDGVDDRAPAPSDWPYENSTLFPRRAPGEPGAWGFDYAALFSDAFAPLLGLVDDEGAPLTLCEAVERGRIHELWIVGSADVPDVNAAEVLRFQQVYDAAGNAVQGLFDRCAGNGCFDADVMPCARSLSIGFVNYARGPGCYLHSIGHGLESLGQRAIVPGLSSWFPRFAGLDLETTGLPVSSFYGVSCDAPPCIAFLDEDTCLVEHQGESHTLDPFDPTCGNVHFPPNGTSHYDYGSPTPVLSSCDAFGDPCGAKSPVSVDDWADYEPLYGDCGGGFLVWWYQHMPAHGSGHRFDDGTPMKPVWPFFVW